MDSSVNTKSTNSEIPVYILSGFLGSGKTTLLQQLVHYWQEEGLRPAVIMNEIGDVNLDGLLVQEQVPMTELLSGCICCSIRGDLSLELANLIQAEKPDVIVIEATGIANPMEILDAVTETSLYMKIDLKGIITVVDAAHLAGLYEEQKGKTYRLMQEQIRCASYLLLNKTDRVEPAVQDNLLSIIRSWNAFAPITVSVRCKVDLKEILNMNRPEQGISVTRSTEASHLSHEHHDQSSSEHPHMHASHDHVMVYTHYFKGAVDSEAFEQLIRNLPRAVYRAKGVLTFSDTASRFLFQYAYRESDYLKITPQGQVPDVAVFIGEHFSKPELRAALQVLEGQAQQ